MRRALAVLLVLAGLVAAKGARAGDDSGAESDEAKKALAVIEKLGLPSVAGKKFVIFNTGQSWEDREGKLRFVYASGWLLEEKENEVELLTRGLVRKKLERDRKLPASWEKHKDDHPKELPLPGEVADVDFEKQCEEFVKAGPTRYFGFEAMEHAREGGLSNHTEACLFAHWEEERGHPDMAKKLLEMAPRALEKGREQGGREKTVTLEAAVTADLSQNLRWQAIVEANERLPRPKLLELWKAIAAISGSDEAKRMVADYESLLAEDAKFTEPAKVDLDKSPPEERAAYWLHRLRDLDARQMMQPGGVSVTGPFSGIPEHVTNPADELVKLGWDAIPTLIESLTDGRPSRCMGYWRDFAPSSYYLLTIGDCCQQIFEEISGERIYERGSTSGAMTKDGRAKAGQEAARAWWEKVKEKGERGYLVEVVSAGGREGAVRAGRLVERFPEDALPALEKGVAASTDDRVRAYLVSVAGSVTKGDPIPLLEREAVPERALPVRIAATRALLGRGRSEAIEPMIGVWEKLPKESREASSLVGLLAGSGDPAAVRALGKDLAKRPMPVREEVLESLGGGGSMMAIHDGEGDGPALGAREPVSKARREAWLAAVEEVLAGSLDDEEVRSGVSGTWNGKDFSDPRIGDIAAHLLWSRWPERYTFDISAPVAERDRQRIVVANVYRKAHDLPLLPVPEKRTVAPADPARVSAALDKFCEGDAAAREKAASELESLGPGALPGVLERIETLAGKAPADELARVASRIDSVVTDVVIAKGSVDPDEPWKKRLDALRGKPLTADGYVDLLVEASKGLPGGAHGFRVAADRTGDGTGVVVTVTFQKTVGAPSGGSFGPGGKRLPSVDHSRRVTLGREALTGSFGSGAADYMAKPEAHKDVHAALEKCLASPAKTPFSATVSLAFYEGDKDGGEEK